MTDAAEEKKSYEIAFLGRDEEDARQVAASLKSSGAEISFEGPVSKANLAYPIRKEQSAHFGYVHFLLEPEKLKQLEESMRMNPRIFRFLIVSPPFVKNRTRTFLPPRRRPSVFPQPAERKTPSLSNEALERQLKEILQ